MSQAAFALQGHNPDVITCIANLSNDEVFTPPEFVNQMLDSLTQAWSEANAGENLWSNSAATFLDPSAKSGVFLREIVKRLNEGLVKELPDLTERVNHILTKQIYGIAITELTSLLTRRTLYCSKNANSVHSIVRGFPTNDGNIWFERLEHDWAGQKCSYCGASRSEYERSGDLETHAYALNHTDNIEKSIEIMFGADMRFDVIIGNPPYQLSTDGAGAQARPIYHQFVQQAIKLDPRFVVMVTPSRWFSGGMALGSFRNEMLKDKRLKEIVDFIQEKDAFPNVNINGGVSYFVWDRDYVGDCKITTVQAGGKYGAPRMRALDEFDIFVRQNDARDILVKVLSKKHGSFSERVSPVDPFKLPTTFHGAPNPNKQKNVKLYGSGAISYISEKEVNANHEWIHSWKVLIPNATDGNENYPLPIWNQSGPIVSSPGEACTFTYLVASLAKSEKEARAISTYMKTKFFRFMVSIRKGTQHNKADTFLYVPELDMGKLWTDALLYKYFDLTSTEIEYIENMIREMAFTNE
jgi:site-specific DNA-methyltransferase (adenine-specific)